MNAPSPSPARRRPRSNLNRLLWVVAACIAGILSLEATLRVGAYTDVSWGKRLRKPHLYADRWSDPLYFRLLNRWTGEPGVLAERIADSRLGWINDGMDRETFADPSEKLLGSRRPVLLFGGSYTRCMTNAGNCFEGWMERSPSGKTHQVFNYGVRGYGIDQMAMLTRLALGHWQDRNALVAIGIYVEDDFDRAILDYRGWPKPRFSLDAKGALIEPEPVPIEDQYDAEHPLWKRSLAWGWLLHGSGLLPASLQRRLAGTERLTDEKKRLSTAILERLERDLKRTGVEHFYILFPSVRNCTSAEADTWQEEFLHRWLDSRDLPYVDVKRDILRAAFREHRHPTEYFGTRGQMAEHLTPDGNEVAFAGLLRGIEGDFDRSIGRQPFQPGELRNLDGLDEQLLRFEAGWSVYFPDEAERVRVLMLPTAALPVRVGCVFTRPARRFKATARLVQLDPGVAIAPVRLEIRVDGELVHEVVLDGSKNSADLSIELWKRRNIEIVASRPDAARSTGNALMLARPRFL